MALYIIDVGLVLDAVAEGAMLTFITAKNHIGQAFGVGLNFESLQAMTECLTKDSAFWQTRDGCFQVAKEEAKVTLVFTSECPPFVTEEQVLEGEAIAKLKEAVAELAARKGKEK